nr:MAG TPA: hypothetical protein [Caudoviricetes sp.]
MLRPVGVATIAPSSIPIKSCTIAHLSDPLHAQRHIIDRSSGTGEHQRQGGSCRAADLTHKRRNVEIDRAIGGSSLGCSRARNSDAILVKRNSDGSGSGRRDGDRSVDIVVTGTGDVDSVAVESHVTAVAADKAAKRDDAVDRDSGRRLHGSVKSGFTRHFYSPFIKNRRDDCPACYPAIGACHVSRAKNMVSEVSIAVAAARRGDDLACAGRSHAVQCRLGQHAALDRVEAAVEAAAAIGDLRRQSVRLLLGKDAVFEALVLHLEVVDGLLQALLVDAAGLTGDCLGAGVDRHARVVALLLNEILRAGRVDDSLLFDLAVAHAVAAGVIDRIRHIAAAKAKPVAKAAEQRRNDDDDKQYRKPAHAGALIVVHNAFSFPQKIIPTAILAGGIWLSAPLCPFAGAVRRFVCRRVSCWHRSAKPPVSCRGGRTGPLPASCARSAHRGCWQCWGRCQAGAPCSARPRACQPSR